MTLQSSWRCLGRRIDGEVQPCDQYGEGPRSDREAQEHTNATQHTTSTSIKEAK